MRSAMLDRLVTRLGELSDLEGMQVEAFPDDPREFQARHLKSKLGAVLVSYAGSRREVVDEGVFGARRLAFDIVVLMRRLGGADGAIALLDSVTDQLDGWRFALDVDLPIVAEVESDRFIGETDQVWQYALRLVCIPL